MPAQGLRSGGKPQFLKASYNGWALRMPLGSADSQRTCPLDEAVCDVPRVYQGRKQQTLTHELNPGFLIHQIKSVVMIGTAGFQNVAFF